MTDSILGRIPKSLSKKADRISEITGLPKTKSFEIISSISPEIIDAKVFKSKNGKKKVKLLMRSTFEF